MNFRPVFLALFLLFVITSGVQAQGAVELVVVKNESVSFTVQSRFEPYLGQAPSDGAIDIVEDPVFNYTITYTPSTDFIGDDGLLLVSFPFDQSIAFQNYEFKVREAFIRANHDFASTAAGTPVSIAPLANDSTNFGALSLTAVPITNAGTAEIVGSDIIFTPAEGFVGLTDLNYSVCTVGGTCTLGTVSINVAPPATASGTDTVRVFTTREKAQYIFAPQDAVSLNEPLSGTMITRDGVMAYLPDAGFAGDEFLTYSLPGSEQQTEQQTVYHVTVLDITPNTFAADDQVYTPANTSRTFNVLHNDLYSVFADCVVFGAPQFGTLREDTPNGQVTYTPPAGWTGVDQFTYSSKSFNCEGEPEVATAYVFVSNFEPLATESQLTAPEGAPLVVTYDAPGGGDIQWSVVTPPTSGTLVRDPLNGHLSYLPGVGSAGSTERFVLAYCLNPAADGNCQFATEVAVDVTVTPPATNACDAVHCVWPGDTNNDGVVDVGDLLPIGLAMGESGIPRLEGSAAWSPQFAEDWAQSTPDGVNLKHVDADGDQYITAADTAVVMANMGLGHRLRPKPQTFATFQLSLRGAVVFEPGDMVVLDLVAGNNAVIVEDVYGIRWPFVYDQAIIDAESVQVSYLEDSWISYDSPILSLASNDPEAGRLETAMTRTSLDGVAGFGKIATLSAVIVEDVYGIRGTTTEEPLTVTLGAAEGVAAVMSGTGNVNAATVEPLTLTITPKPATPVNDFTPADATAYLEGKLLTFPNPTTGQLTVHLNGQQQFSALQLSDMTGRVLRVEEGLQTNHRTLQLDNLPDGVYLLTITTGAGVVNRKIELLR